MTVMREVRSSNIRKIGYVEEAQVLIVTFSAGATWTYDGVPPEIDEELRRIEAAGESIGKYFAAHIKNQYPATRVPEAENLLAAG